MNDDNLTLEEKLSILSDRAKDIGSFIEQLTSLKGKLEKKKHTIKDIIEKKIEDNQKELNKWKELLFTVVDESLDEKIQKLDSQTRYFATTKTEIDSVLENTRTTQAETASLGESDEESEDPKLDDLLELELNLQPEGLTQTETTEMESRVKNDFNILLNEPKKSLRRTFAYVGGIIRGYLRRGKSNIDWIKIMRKLEGREFEDRVLSETDPYVGAKINTEEAITLVKENVSHTWNSMTKLFENRNNPETRDEFCAELYKYYDQNPEDVEFYLPQLCNLLLNQYYQFQPLKKFILEKCSQSIHFALQTYLLVRASKDSREPPKKKKIIPPSIVKWRILCDQLMSEIVKNVRIPPTSQLPSSNQENENIVEEVFKFPIQFMDRLVDISNSLPSVPSDQYSPELIKRVDKENKFLQEEYARTGAFVYIPLLKPVGSADYHRVIRIPSSEAFPIPTYGRVLYYILVEVIDAPPIIEHSHEKEEKRKHKKEKKSKKEKKEKKEMSDKEILSASVDGLASSADDLAASVHVQHGQVFEMEGDDAKEVMVMSANPIGSVSPKKSGSKEVIEEPVVDQLKSSEEISPKPHDEAKDQTPIEDKMQLIHLEDRHHSEEKHHKKKKKEKKEEGEEGEHKKHHKKKKEKDSSAYILPGGSEHSSPKGDAPINQLNSSTGGLNFSSNSYFVAEPLGHHSAYGEMWDKKVKRIKAESPHGINSRWRMLPLIVKAGEEVLQEEFAMQLIVQFQRIFHESGVPVKLIPYRILAISAKSGLIEPVPNSLSLDKLKKKHTNLLNFFIQAFGETSGPVFKQAQMNFVKTMAAYSVVCYLLQIKDRHNGNILVDASGHIIHIDFGYLLSKSIAFEKAPFKLTTEFVDVMGGYKSPCYKEYCRLCVRAFLAVRKHYKKIMLLVEMTMEGKGKKVLPCLQDGQKVLDDLKTRFHLDWTDEQVEKYIMELIEDARGSWRTILYDAYQLILNNIH